MAFVSVTRLRLHSLRFLYPFLLENLKVIRQLRRAEGFVGGKLLVDRNRVFWTLSVWSEQASMSRFRGRGAHKKAMPRLALWCCESAVMHWEVAGLAIPDWPEAHRRMLAGGWEYPLKNRSPTFSIGTIPAPRMPRKLLLNFGPAKA